MKRWMEREDQKEEGAAEDLRARWERARVREERERKLETER